MEQEHKRRVRYKGTHPRSYQEKYKELNPEKYSSDVDKIKKRQDPCWNAPVHHGPGDPGCSAHSAR